MNPFATDSEIIFDVALETAQRIPQEAVPFYLALLAGPCEALDPELVGSLQRALDVTISPEAVTLRRWHEATRAGEAIKAAALERWLRHELRIPEVAWGVVQEAQATMAFQGNTLATWLNNPTTTARTAVSGKEFRPNEQ